MDTLGGETGMTCDAETAKERKRRHRRQILNNLFDFLAIVSSKWSIGKPFLHDKRENLSLLACLIFGLIYLFIKPNRRGFFCDDTSIQYPFRPDTIPMWLLAIYGGVVPIIIVRGTMGFPCYFWCWCTLLLTSVLYCGNLGGSTLSLRSRCCRRCCKTTTHWLSQDDFSHDFPLHFGNSGLLSDHWSRQTLVTSLIKEFVLLLDTSFSLQGRSVVWDPIIWRSAVRIGRKSTVRKRLIRRVDLWWSLSKWQCCPRIQLEWHHVDMSSSIIVIQVLQIWNFKKPNYRFLPATPVMQPMPLSSYSYVEQLVFLVRLIDFFSFRFISKHGLFVQIFNS